MCCMYLFPWQPLAVVTWGCIYEMGWVNPDKVKEWLEDRDVVVGVNLNEQSVLYDRGSTVNRQCHCAKIHLVI